jgi:hypothetical protein
MATLTNQTPHTPPSFAGQVFYAWLFWFTIPGVVSSVVNVSKNSGSIINISKH